MWLYRKCLLPLKRRLEVLKVAKEADIVIVHKTMTHMHDRPSLEALLKQKHPKIIYNFDDAVHERGIPYLSERIGLSHATWTGHTTLQDYARNYCASNYLIPSAVDTEHYSAKLSYERKDPLLLVWSGTVFSLHYLDLITDAIEELAQTLPLKLRIICRERPSLSLPDDLIQWCPFDPATEQALLTESDIAVMPLHDGAYERAKENYKIKMYGACGLPTVCSPVGMNQDYISDGVDGLFAQTPEAWCRQIQRLAMDAALRETMGRRLREKMCKHYSIPVIGEQLINMFNAFLET